VAVPLIDVMLRLRGLTENYGYQTDSHGIVSLATHSAEDQTEPSLFER
jgi:hypothetical protein